MFSSFSSSMSPGRRNRSFRQLYPFDSFTFTSAGIRGRTGPTVDQLRTFYNTSTYTWLTNTNYFNTATNTGIQLWTVPKTGTYRIVAKGAQGSNPQTSVSSTFGGRGAVMQGDFDLIQGEKLLILVGQIAPNSGRTNLSSSGGGGSWVVKYTGTQSTTTDILIVAGGGGGTNSNTPILSHASTSTTGNNAMQFGSTSGGDGGSNGQGGIAGNASANGAGGGFLTNGTSNGGSGGGKSFISGGQGGEINVPYATLGGGFGGGGAPNNGTFGRCSGGGGYSGGGASNIGSDNAPQADLAGGGGGSYNIGINQINQTGDALGNVGTGSVIITFLQFT